MAHKTKTPAQKKAAKKTRSGKTELEREFERPICALAFGAKGDLAVGTADGISQDE